MLHQREWGYFIASNTSQCSKFGQRIFNTVPGRSRCQATFITCEAYNRLNFWRRFSIKLQRITQKRLEMSASRFQLLSKTRTFWNYFSIHEGTFRLEILAITLLIIPFTFSQKIDFLPEFFISLPHKTIIAQLEIWRSSGKQQTSNQRFDKDLLWKGHSVVFGSMGRSIFQHTTVRFFCSF